MYRDRVEYSESVLEIAWRRGDVEVNESRSSARAVRLATNRGWVICSTTRPVAWDVLEEEALRLAGSERAESSAELAEASLYVGRVMLGESSADPLGEGMRAVDLARALLEEKGLTGEVVLVFSETERRLEHPSGSASERKTLSELYVYADARLEGSRAVGSAHAAVLGPPSKISPKSVESLVEKAARRALWGLRAKKLSPLERGPKTVLLMGEASAAFFHELSHLLEADVPEHIALGTLVSSKSLTVYDDPFDPESPASVFFDDEAVSARKRTLVEDGVAVGLLHTRETASLHGDAPGSARGLFHRPKAMQSTIVVSSGDNWRESEIVEETRSGLLIDGVVEAELRGGTVRLVPEEAWIVAKGEVREPIKLEELKLPLLHSLTRIDAVGRAAYLRASYEKKHLVAERAPWVRTVAYVA
ncbi:MAG: TldD/PmbA family protein [Fervidicoccaceae archaeon]